MKAALSSRSHTCSSKALPSRAISHHTVPGTTVVTMASAASAEGSRNCKGMMTKPSCAGARAETRSTPRSTCRLDSSTSQPTVRM